MRDSVVTHSISMRKHWPLPPGCEHPNKSLSTRQPTYQIRISPAKREGCCEGLAAVHCPSPVHWCSHSTVESHKVAQAGIALSRGNHYPILYVSCQRNQVWFCLRFEIAGLALCLVFVLELLPVYLAACDILLWFAGVAFCFVWSIST